MCIHIMDISYKYAYQIEVFESLNEKKNYSRRVYAAVV